MRTGQYRASEGLFGTRRFYHALRAPFTLNDYNQWCVVRNAVTGGRVKRNFSVTPWHITGYCERTVTEHHKDGMRETADYIASLAGELARLAEAGRMPLLSYLLEMARQEANSIVHDDNATRPDDQ